MILAPKVIKREKIERKMPLINLEAKLVVFIIQREKVDRKIG